MLVVIIEESYAAMCKKFFSFLSISNNSGFTLLGFYLYYLEDVDIFCYISIFHISIFCSYADEWKPGNGLFEKKV